MTRLMSLLALTGSIAATVWASLALMETAQRPDYSLPTVAAPEPQLSVDATGRISPPFLAIYGSPAVQEAQVAVAADEPFPFVLKGLIVVGDARWAVLSREGIDVVVREGEILEGGAEIIQVRAEGVDLVTEDGPMTLGFNADAPVSLTEIASATPASSGSGPKGNFDTGGPAEMLFQDMSSDDILAALEQAEAQRIARGWVTQSD